MSANPGGRFLTEHAAVESTFTPEDLSPEHCMIRDLTKQFVEKEVAPQLESLERQEWGTTVNLLKRCADLGLLGIEAPAEYGGEDLDKVSAMIVAEEFARVASFGVSYGGQAGIGMLPLVYFARPDLKQKYLPALCRAEKISAYALSEAASGSDALAAKTTATASPDGKHWILRGEKMWITNAAFADIFITFAQVDGTQFSCFVVEKTFPGVSTGAEERKMGLKGSSTRPLILDDAVVPSENLVGEVGKGHHVAFNILNIGRAKLGAIAVGAGQGRAPRLHSICQATCGFRKIHCELRRHPTQARRDGNPHLGRGKYGLSHGGADRHGSQHDRCNRPRAGDGGHQGVRSGVFDPEGVRFRSSGLRGRRSRSDLRRLRL